VLYSCENRSAVDASPRPPTGSSCRLRTQTLSVLRGRRCVACKGRFADRRAGRGERNISPVPKLHFKILVVFVPARFQVVPTLNSEEGTKRYRYQTEETDILGGRCDHPERIRQTDMAGAFSRVIDGRAAARRGCTAVPCALAPPPY